MLKHILPTSLMGRSLLILTVPILIIQIVTGYVFFDRHWERMISQLCFSVVGEIAYVIEEIEQRPHAITAEEMGVITGRSIRHTDILLSYAPGATLARPRHVIAEPGWEGIVASILAPAVDSRIERPYKLRFDFADKWVYLDVQLSSGVLSAQIPERRVFSSSGYIYLLWVLASAIILLMVAVLFMRNQIRPIRKLAAAAQLFARGADLSQFKPEGAREVRQAGQSFLEMAKSIRRQMEQRALMLAGVSHDLRTPITRLRLALSMFEKNEDTKAMEGDLREMEAMITGYLDYVRGVSDEAFQHVSVQDFFGTLIQAQKRGGHALNAAPLPEGTLETKPVALSRCLKNILVNAQRYAAQTWVDLTWQNQGETLCVVIEDDGPGIDEDDYEDVFKPFFRTNKARSASQGSVGLGLSIARDVVDAVGGQITLSKSATYGGLRVQILLPARQI